MSYDDLRLAILESAITDYKAALQKKNKSGAVAFERWFKSEYGEAVSNGNGAYIIEQCQKEFEQVADVQDGYCRMCGKIIPKGRQYCINCEFKIRSSNNE